MTQDPAWRPCPAPDMPDGLILFDGVCVLCAGWVRFVVRHDHAGRFRFASVQQEPGRSMAQRLGIDPDAPETNAVVLDGTAYFKFDSILVVLGQFRGGAAVRPLWTVPRGIRNWGYDRVARNRYSLFGRTA